MKKSIVFLSLLLISSAIQAQSITLGSITKLSYCVGDEVSVPYTAKGPFGSANSFKVELSDANGSFGDFSNAGSMTVDNGSFWVTLSSPGSRYRLRVISTDPYVASADNGSDILVVPIPSPSPTAVRLAGRYTFSECNCYFGAGVSGQSIKLGDNAGEPAGSTFSWTLDQDASPPTSSSPTPIVTYTTPGIKTGTLSVAAPEGCEKNLVPFAYQVYTCTPSIPATARIVTDVESGSDSVVWVQSGGTYTMLGTVSQTVFAEPGASVYDMGTYGQVSYSTLYLKSESSFTLSGNDFVTVVTPANNKGNIPGSADLDIFTCPDFSFDYSQLPANERPTATVANAPCTAIHITESDDMLFASSEASELSVQVFSTLGLELLARKGSGECDLDLHSLPDGVYFAVVHSGSEQAVRKITVVH